MAQCKKTPGCIFQIQDDEIGPCATCAGFGVITNPDKVAGRVTPTVQCTTCLGTKTVKLIDNKSAVHAGPCLQATDCVCDMTPGVWATLTEQGRYCPVHKRRTTLDPTLKAREDAAIATSTAQKAADDAALAAKIDAAVTAKRWIDVPEPRRSVEMVKAGVAVEEVEEIKP